MADEDRELDDTVEMPAITDAGDDLMTRKEVAYLFKTTSTTVYWWARRKHPPLHEIRNTEGKPRYRRTEVEALHASGFRG